MLIHNDNSCVVSVFPPAYRDARGAGREEAMVESEQDKSIYRPAGYAALIERYDLAVIPNWHESIVTASGIHRLDSREGVMGRSTRQVLAGGYAWRPS